MKIQQETIRASTLSALQTVASNMGAELVDPIQEDTVLLETGLDSLGFAMLVASLEEDIGFDPFSLTDEATYPVTFGQFIDFYYRHQPQS